MDYVTEEAIRAIEQDLTQRLVQEFKVDWRCLVYDTTNFVSFLDSATASELAQRGHFIASLSLAGHDDLLAVPLSNYTDLGGRWAGERAFRTQQQVWGQERTLVLTFNPTLYAGQIQGLAQHLKKATQALKELQRNLTAWREGRIKKGRSPQLSSVQAQVKRCLAAPYLDQILTVQVGEEQGLPPLSFTVEEAALSQVAQRYFGKTIGVKYLLHTPKTGFSPGSLTTKYTKHTKGGPEEGKFFPRRGRVPPGSVLPDPPQDISAPCSGIPFRVFGVFRGEPSSERYRPTRCV
jgi:hypothetical protein